MPSGIRSAARELVSLVQNTAGAHCAFTLLLVGPIASISRYMHKTLFVGAVAGLTGAFAMQTFRSAWNRYYADAPQHGVFGLDEEADLNSVDFLTILTVNRALPEQRSMQIALALHYMYGLLAGVGYTAAVEKLPLARCGYGTFFGAALWVFGDELPVTLTKLSDPMARSIRSHASALGAHLLFGSVVEAVRSAQRRYL